MRRQSQSSVSWADVSYTRGCKGRPWSLHRAVLVCFLLLSIFLGVSQVLGQKNSERTQSEEAEDYFEKWLNEDVVYIITEGGA